MGSCAAPSAKGDDKFITTDYLQQCRFTLRTGRKGLITLLEEWQAVGVNHAALGIQFAQRPAAEIIQELAEYVLPHFASHQEQPALATAW
ncbi:hypothetical protein HBO10_30985 [Pseudomonas sp. WS 5503]|nr:hypothetical protein [Pseudomonas sp. WS 5503]NNB23972.1 hypothetical protein [Pseudomonas fragi]